MPGGQLSRSDGCLATPVRCWVLNPDSNLLGVSARQRETISRVPGSPQHSGWGLAGRNQGRHTDAPHLSPELEANLGCIVREANQEF